MVDKRTKKKLCFQSKSGVSQRTEVIEYFRHCINTAEERARSFPNLVTYFPTLSDQDYMLALALQQEDASALPSASEPIPRGTLNHQTAPVGDEAVALALHREERALLEQRIEANDASIAAAGGQRASSREDSTRRADTPQDRSRLVLRCVAWVVRSKNVRGTGPAPPITLDAVCASFVTKSASFRVRLFIGSINAPFQSVARRVFHRRMNAFKYNIGTVAASLYGIEERSHYIQ